MTNKIGKNIIFDWSGTLSDNFNSFYFVVMKFCEHFCRPIPTKEEVKEIFTIPYMIFWNRLFPSLSFEEQNKLYEKFIHLAPDAKIIPGIKETVIELKNRGYRIFILSSDPKSKIFNEIQYSGLMNTINGVICDVHDKSAELTKLASDNHMNTSDSFYVGDSIGDIECGRCASFKTIGVTWGFNNRTVIEKADPDHIIDNIGDILKLFS